ncbi:MAG: DNA mismatch repair protein MutS [Anaerolineae bacterium]|nr:DNA mismatch repair protein MutS [Anaerolineae bacterium]
MTPPDSTPARKQYLQIKAQYPDTIVFFRLGDFYECFDEDARVAARVCDIVLTSRPVGHGERVPLAGVPYHAVDGYIARLIQAGHKVAIVDQLGSTPIKGLVPRQVSRVVTPGTVVEPTLLDEKRNNYLAALVVDGGRAGLSYVDITTGEFATTELSAGRAIGDTEKVTQAIWRLVHEELERLQVAELLVTEAFQAYLATNVHITVYENRHFDLDNARRILQDQFDVASLAGFGCEGKPLAIRAAGAILHYLQDTQQGALPQLSTLSTYSSSEYITLDPATRRNLELARAIRADAGTARARGSLLGVLDQTTTAMGARLLRQWINQPLLDRSRLNARLDLVEHFTRHSLLRAEVRKQLNSIPDLERLVGRLTQNRAGPRDLLGIRHALEAIPALHTAFESVDAASQVPPSALRPLLDELDPCEQTRTLIAKAIADQAPALISGGDAIRPGFSEELDGLLIAVQDAKTWIASLEQRERQLTGIKTLKVGFNKVFGYYIEVTRANTDAVPEGYVRKQTLVNAERYITSELKEYETMILNAEERKAEIETRIFREICQRLAAAAAPILNTARALAHLDVFSALAEVAVNHRYVRPILTDSGEMHVKAGRHPVVELTMRQQPFVPNDVHLSGPDGDERLLIITGPNMSGKSTYIRQVALLVLMAQIGSFVPADEATIGLVDRIFTRIGAQDEISAGQSTFMVEMVEAAYILNHATKRSLIILDEIGRGTSTYDGVSIAWSMVEYIHNHPRLGAKTLFATHYHELADLARILPQVRNYNVNVAEQGDQVIFLHQIVPGSADKSYGIHVAQLAGMPKPVVHRAQEILEQLEGDAARAPGQAHQLREPAPALAGDPAAGSGPRSKKPQAQVLQLPLFQTSSPVEEALQAIDVNALTPIEALTRLYELQRMVNDP